LYVECIMSMNYKMGETCLLCMRHIYKCICNEYDAKQKLTGIYNVNEKNQTAEVEQMIKLEGFEKFLRGQVNEAYTRTKTSSNKQFSMGRQL
jgi:hypothetical protein